MFAKYKLKYTKGGIYMKIKNIKKFVRGILIILGIILTVSLFISKVTYSHGEKQYKTIFVSEGDTLWTIASLESKSNAYYKNKDVREIINNILKENNLNNSTIKINQELKIPI